MKITRKSAISGVERTLDLPITPMQYHAWQMGTLIQNAMPDLSNDEREFILTGITKEEWDATFKEEE